MKRLAGIAITASAAFLAGCGGSAPPEARGRDVVRPALRFALDVPKGWSVRDLNGDVVLEVVAPALAPTGTGPLAAAPAPPAAATGPDAGPDARPDAPSRQALLVVHVVVIDREGLADLAAWADAAIREDQALQSDLAVARREPARLADGREALRMVLDHPRGAEPMEQRMLLAMTGRFAYGLLATGSKRRLADAEADLKTCFDTFVVW
jgi:hypothetical protein